MFFYFLCFSREKPVDNLEQPRIPLQQRSSRLGPNTALAHHREAKLQATNPQRAAARVVVSRSAGSNPAWSAWTRDQSLISFTFTFTFRRQPPPLLRLLLCNHDFDVRLQDAPGQGYLRGRRLPPGFPSDHHKVPHQASHAPKVQDEGRRRRDRAHHRGRRRTRTSHGHQARQPRGHRRRLGHKRTRWEVIYLLSSPVVLVRAVFEWIFDSA